MFAWFCMLVFLAGDRHPFASIDDQIHPHSSVRLATGEPGPQYWQQKVDYQIDVDLDEPSRSLRGREKVTYHNRSPHDLSYLWLQLDQNIHASDSVNQLSQVAPDFNQISVYELLPYLLKRLIKGGFTDLVVKDLENHPMIYKVRDTMMRVELPQPLKAGTSFSFVVEWRYVVPIAVGEDARNGYEPFGNGPADIFLVGQWFPRLAAYTDYKSWQNQVFTEDAEFTLEFGDYDVNITVPRNHVVAATGQLVNANEVLSDQQRERLKRARESSEVVQVVRVDEATARITESSSERATWRFRASNVRDFAWASSKQFVWECQSTGLVSDQLAMAYFPPVAAPLWQTTAVESMVFALNSFNQKLFAYPYPHVTCVNGSIGGMEYPMLGFCGTRPDEQGAFDDRIKAELVSVIFHEVAHNYIPMIINSDEREWTWLDEGLVSYLTHRAEQEYQPGFPSDLGSQEDIAFWMKEAKQVPMMSRSDLLYDVAGNAYAKPTAAMWVLRDLIIGPDEFDRCLKKFASVWQFKRPLPGDFFRFFEQFTAIDLDWFWHGWFFTTDHVDMALTDVTRWRPNKRHLPDGGYDDLEKELLESDDNYYVIEVENIGGLIMPLPILLEFTDHTLEQTMDASVFRFDRRRTAILVISKSELLKVVLDPKHQLIDADVNNQTVYGPFPKTPFNLIPASAFQLLDHHDAPGQAN